MNRLKTWSVAFAAAALTTLAFAGAASAAPVVGPAGEAFYTAPASLPAANGTLIQYRSNTLSLGSGSPGVKSWQVMYKSSKVDGTAVATTGTVIVPTAVWTGGGSRPIVTYALGTQGIGKQCAGSKQLVSGKEYEIANIVAALKRGYAVVITDYDGYTLGGKPTYSVAGNEGRAVLDIVRAADDIPFVGISASNKTAIWGYSIGGQAAASAGEIEATATPPSSTSSPSPPVAFRPTFAQRRRTSTAPTARRSCSPRSTASRRSTRRRSTSPRSPTLTGQAVIADGATLCTFEALFKYINKNVSEYTVGNKTMNTLLAEPAIGAVVDAQKLGNTKPARRCCCTTARRTSSSRSRRL